MFGVYVVEDAKVTHAELPDRANLLPRRRNADELLSPTSCLRRFVGKLCLDGVDDSPLVRRAKALELQESLGDELDGEQCDHNCSLTWRWRQGVGRQRKRAIRFALDRSEFFANTRP